MRVCLIAAMMTLVAALSGIGGASPSLRAATLSPTAQHLPATDVHAVAEMSACCAKQCRGLQIGCGERCDLSLCGNRWNRPKPESSNGAPTGAGSGCCQALCQGKQIACSQNCSCGGSRGGRVFGR
jgi:hypothetical protein